MSKSIAKNFMYNLLYQIVTLFMPLLTVPYVSRILGKEGIGLYSYTLSIVQYFVIIGTLGISMYGNRQIAYVRDNKRELSKAFWSITVLKAITTIIAFIIYILIFGFNKQYSTIYLIQSLNIIGATLDISWLYMGLEDFKKTVTRNLFIKIICVICIFVFVKSYNDLNKYILINAFMAVLGNLVMWMYIPKVVFKVRIKIENIKSHIMPAISLFIPQIAIQVYAVLDKTMLGILADTSEVGLYEQSQKIVKLVLSLVTALGVVMLPRMSNTFANGDSKKMNEYLNNSLKGVAYVSVPMAFGLAAVSNQFVPWFFGKGFEPVSYLMIILTPILFFIAMSNVLGTQYLLPTNRTREFTFSVICGAIVNVTLNFALIPYHKSLGACIATVIAELTVTLVQYMCLRNRIESRLFFVSLFKYIIGSVVMFILVRIIGNSMGAKIVTTIIQGVCGIIIYPLVLLILKEKINLIIIKNISVIVKSKIISTKKLTEE